MIEPKLKPAPRQKGRPKSLEKRKAIRDAAVGLFFKEGWAGTSMDSIAAQAGVSKQTVYSHFSSKEVLFTDCIRFKLDLYQLDASNIDRSDLTQALCAYGRRFLALMEDQEVIGMYRLLIGHCEQFPDLVKQFYQIGPEATAARVAELLVECDQARFADSPVTAATRFLIMVREPFFMDLIMNLRTGISEAEKRAHLDQVVPNFLSQYDIISSNPQ